MQRRDTIVIGASAGGVEALQQLVRQLPPDLAAAVFVVLHIPPDGTSVLPSILNRAGPLPVSHPHDGQAVEPGRIFVAPPNYHLLLKDGRVRLARGPRENGHRPAADALFRTAARVRGPRVIGVVLSGALDDGTAGLIAIKRHGGIAVVQDPADALYPSMPVSALERVHVDHCVGVAEMGTLLTRLIGEPVDEGAGQPAPDELAQEADMAELETAAMQDVHRAGVPSVFACPDCGGVLWELDDGGAQHFRCRVGHAWSPDSLLNKQNLALEDALWTALRALEESAALSRRLAAQAAQRGMERAAVRFRQQVKEAEGHALTLRQVLLSYRTVAPPDSADDKPGGAAGTMAVSPPPEG